MQEIIFTDPETFEEIKHEFDDFHMGIARSIQGDLPGYNTTSIISNKDGDKLFVGILKDRKPGEEVAEKYRIIIEKINP